MTQFIRRGSAFVRHPYRNCLSAVIATLISLSARDVTAINPAPTTNVRSGPATPLTVAFWNIQWFPGGKPDATENAENRQTLSVHNDMRRLNADIIGMEEVRNWDAAALAVQPLTGMKVDVCANFPPREGQREAQEVAIASRLQPISAWVELWKPAGKATPPRGFAFAAYEPKPRQLLLVYCVHFKSNRDGVGENIPIREEATRQLLSHIEAMKTAYRGMGQVNWILGGDFNTSLDDPQFGAENTLRNLMKNGFSWTWQNVPAPNRMTLHGDANYPPASFDHIFYRGLTLRKAEVIPTTRQSSDHKPIMATFEW
jgi:endonuclease/exonuclease/phosphatase (EEP) superfamily protein YafD